MHTARRLTRPSSHDGSATRLSALERRRYGWIPRCILGSSCEPGSQASTRACGSWVQLGARCRRHAAARVAALAGPGEVLDSATTRDLLDGSGFPLEPGGERELKG